jgi:hypothetical protein
MANTERLNAIRQVRLALDAVASARFDPALPTPDRQQLETAYGALDEVEGVLILQEINERLDALRSDSDNLAALARKMAQSAQRLQAIADLIDRAAKAVAALVEIAAKASSAGLV